jgi:hypothetical protein
MCPRVLHAEDLSARLPGLGPGADRHGRAGHHRRNLMTSFYRAAWGPLELFGEESASRHFISCYDRKC